MTPLRLSPEHAGWDAILRLILDAFASMEGRIDPPSSALRLTPEAMAAQARAGEVWALFEDGAPVACVFLTPRADALYIGKLAVRPDRQRRGLGRRLVALAEERAAARGLATLELQTRIELAETHAAFAQLSFARAGETCHPGFDRPTSVTMRKRLAPEAAA